MIPPGLGVRLSSAALAEGSDFGKGQFAHRAPRPRKSRRTTSSWGVDYEGGKVPDCSQPGLQLFEDLFEFWLQFKQRCRIGRRNRKLRLIGHSKEALHDRSQRLLV